MAKRALHKRILEKLNLINEDNNLSDQYIQDEIKNILLSAGFKAKSDTKFIYDKGTYGFSSYYSDYRLEFDTRDPKFMDLTFQSDPDNNQSGLQSYALQDFLTYAQDTLGRGKESQYGISRIVETNTANIHTVSIYINKPSRLLDILPNFIRETINIYNEGLD